MRPPSIKLGKWKITYKQVVHEDRYFFAYYNNYLIAKISKHFHKTIWKFLPYGFIEDRNESQYYLNRWDRFLERVEQYDKELDKKINES